MKDSTDNFLYPEQYELHSVNQLLQPVSRRSFFKLAGTGVAVAFSLKDLLAAEVIEQLSDEKKFLAEDTIAAWIHIKENGVINVFTGKVEVGQQIRTSLAQIVAEELEAPFESIDMIMGDTLLTPYDRGTFGSRTTPFMGPQLRKAAASLREVLLQLAADEWKVNASILKAEKGNIVNPSGNKSLSYASLSAGKQILKPVNTNVKVKPRDQWKIAGKSVPRARGRDFITGKHRYSADIKLPGMLYGKLLRAPAYGSSLISVDTSRAKSVAGVTVVEEKDFVGVLATDSQTAEQALWSIRAEWKHSPQPSRNEIFQYLKDKSQSGRSSTDKGDVKKVFDASKEILEQKFQIDYIAHAPLEPRAAVAQWEGNKLTVWTGTQRPFGVQEELQSLFKIPKENIRVIMPDTGSGYGGKHTGDAALEAARLARAVGKPVKLVWTREEEFKWAYFRPAGLIEVKSTVNNDGLVSAWEFHNYNSGAAGIQTPYEVAHQKIQFHPVDSPLRQGSYRALASTANVFARECQMNDMAAAKKIDPLQFRLNNLKEERLKNVLEATAKSFGWNKSKTINHGYGIACGFEKGGYIATAVEVQANPVSKNINIVKIVSAFECGAIINPRHLKSQVIGCILQGLGGALFEAVDFKEGKILNPSFSGYRVPRFMDIPEIEIVLIDRKDIDPAGGSEAPIIGIAPAIRNAIFDATGVRLNNLPMFPNGMRV